MKDKQPIIITDNIAIIKEADCIGCTKCIRVCPVDAILGAAKHMHTVINDECTGCELCIASCPVNCITLRASSLPQAGEGSLPRPKKGEVKRQSAEQRLNFRKFRLQRDRMEKIKKQETIQTRKAAIQAAILRAQEKRLFKKMDGQ